MDHYRVNPAYIELRSDVVSEWTLALQVYQKELEAEGKTINPEEQFYIAKDWTLTIVYMPYPDADNYLMIELDPEAWQPASQIL